MNEAGVAFVPADRHRFGLVLDFDVADNLVLTSYYRPPYARGILRNEDAIEAAAKERRRPSTSARRRSARKASTLSGGNQQKVVVGREFDRDLTLLDPRPADARPRRRQHRVHPPPDDRASATPAPRSCSSPPSSTRSSSCPTGSR